MGIILFLQANKLAYATIKINAGIHGLLRHIAQEP
jgi:hypothetical protein